MNTFVHLFSLYPRVQSITHFINVYSNSNNDSFIKVNLLRRLRFSRRPRVTFNYFSGRKPRKFLYQRVHNALLIRASPTLTSLFCHLVSISPNLRCPLWNFCRMPMWLKWYALCNKNKLAHIWCVNYLYRFI